MTDHSPTWFIDRPGIYTIRCICGWEGSDGSRQFLGDPDVAFSLYEAHKGACGLCGGTGRERRYIDPAGRVQPTDRPCVCCCRNCHRVPTPGNPIGESRWCAECEDEARARAIPGGAA